MVDAIRELKEEMCKEGRSAVRKNKAKKATPFAKTVITISKVLTGACSLILLFTNKCSACCMSTGKCASVHWSPTVNKEPVVLLRISGRKAEDYSRVNGKFDSFINLHRGLLFLPAAMLRRML